MSRERPAAVAPGRALPAVPSSTWLAAGLLLLAGCGGDVPGDEAAAARPDAAAGMSIEALYSLPSLIGTSPGLMQWSEDGETLAFAWNDGGLPFRDAWAYTPADGSLRRLTHHADDVEAGSLREGIAELTWLRSGAFAYVLDGRLYLADAEGGVAEQPFERVRRLSYSMARNALAFAGADEGGGSALWLLPLDDDGSARGDARLVVPAGHEGVSILSHEWSADGARIAFVRADDRRVAKREIHYYADGGELQVDRVTRAFPGEETTARALGVVALDDGSVKWLELENEQDPIWGYGLSADGSRLFANTSDHLVKTHTIFTFDVASGERQTFYRHTRPENVIPGWGAAWAPGGEGLIILTDRDGWYHLWHQAEAGGEPKPLTSGEWEIASFEVDAANGQIWFVANRSHPSERQVYRVPAAGGAVERVTTEPGTWAPVFSPDFSRIALHFSNDTTPPDLYTLAADPGDEIRRVTHSPLPAFDDYRWADVRYPEFHSHVDGTPLFARLSVPADFEPSRRYPLIVGSVYADTLRNQWGGRTAHPTWGIDQYFVARGYLVLNVNMRGSWGHGQAFSQGLLGDYGGIDTDDIESGVRYLVAQGYVDPERVGIWGSSYGGLMTLMSLFKKPGLYAAGIAGAPATNVWHAFPSQMWVMGEPRGDDYPERYRRQSALFHHEGLEDPLMIIHGTRDPVVLYSDTIALVERMIASGKQFELVTLPGGSHSWATDSLEQTRSTFSRMAEFFDRHLQNPSSPR